MFERCPLTLENATDNLRQRAYLYDIEVLPGFRKRGVGKAVMNATLKYLKFILVEEMWLGSAIDNYPANALHKSTGGEPSEETFYDYTFK